jgi:hypothetical protein
VVAVVHVERLQLKSFDALASVLAEGRAAYLAFDIGKVWHSLQSDAVPDYEFADGGKHAVAAVGYRINGPRGREVLIHNSWGAGWAAGGYAWISEATLRTHNIDAFVLEVKVLGSSGPPKPGPGTPAPPLLPFPYPFPLPVPGTRVPGGSVNTGTGCAAGQVNDRFTGGCVPPCANGTAPANGLCLPF